MKNIKAIFWEEYTSWLKEVWGNFDFDWTATKGPLSDWIWIVFDKNKDLSETLFTVIWEAPWAEETLNSCPFFWQAWKNLRENLWDESEFYITNSIKFRPIEKTEKSYKNRTPSKTETKYSSIFLQKELEYLESIWKNKILLVWNKALETMLFVADNNKNSKITLEGNEISIKEIKKIKTSDLINNFIDFEINWKKYQAYLIFHTSPLNYNKKDKKESIKEGIKSFLEKIK